VLLAPGPCFSKPEAGARAGASRRFPTPEAPARASRTYVRLRHLVKTCCGSRSSPS